MPKITGSSIILFTVVTLIFIFSSCNKIAESIQRDIIVTSAPVAFTIPQITTIDDIIDMGSFNATVNVDSLIKAQDHNFNISNLRSIKFTSVSLELAAPLDSANNIANFGLIAVNMRTPALQDTLIAGINYTSTAIINKLTIPVITVNPEIKDYITSTSLRYSLIGQSKKLTTKSLSAKATFTYKFTVSK